LVKARLDRKDNPTGERERRFLPASHADDLPKSAKDLGFGASTAAFRGALDISVVIPTADVFDVSIVIPERPERPDPESRTRLSACIWIPGSRLWRAPE
jgi:hypothetical protein